MPERKAQVDGGSLANTTSVFSHIEQGLRSNPHGQALICMHQAPDHLQYLFDASQGEHDCLSITYAQLHTAALRVAAGLLARGAQPNSTVLMLIPNGAEYIVLLWTCILMRLTIVSLDPLHLADMGLTDLKDIVTLVQPSIVIVPDKKGAQRLDHVLAKTQLEHQFLGMILEDGRFSQWRSLREWVLNAVLASSDEQVLLDKAKRDDPDRTHCILFTSGTSGKPKGCPIRVSGMTHLLHSQSWLINPANCAFALEQAHNSRAIAPAQMLQTWRVGGAVVMTGQGLLVEDMAEAIAKFNVTFMVLTPAMVHEMSKLLALKPFDSSSVRTIQIGGDAVTKGVLERCSALFPRAQVCVNHGMTEGGGSFDWPFFGRPVSMIPCFGEICPIGRVAPGAKVRIWDPDECQVSKTHVPGEMHVSCGTIISGYLDGRSSESFYEDDEGRWFNTGDVAMIDNEGLVFILGRKKDMIKRDGTMVVTTAIESTLETFVGVQAVVVSATDHRGREVTFAVLSDYNNKSRKDIDDHVKSVLGLQYALGGVVSLEQIALSRFPINETHKIVRSTVQDAVKRFVGGSFASTYPEVKDRGIVATEIEIDCLELEA